MTSAQCQRCSSPVESGALFCSKCGMDVSSISSGSLDDTLAATVISGQQQPAPSRSTMRQALRDATLGEYEILNELGRGGMATVFLAHDISLDRKVAIKVMAPHLLEGEGMAERFKLEARTAAQLSHPHIIPIYAVKETANMLYFVMKFVEGKELGDVMRRTGQLPIPMVKDVLTKVGSALGYAHRRDVVHRDIKPGNIMIDEEGTPIVTDFGIAKVAETSGLTMTGSTIGTPSYMSPEQCEAKPVAGASDQYSLGVLAFEMLTGALPFEADSPVTIMYKHVHEELPVLEDFRPDCPPEVVETVTRMLAKDPADRWPSMEAAIQKLRSATGSGMAAVVSGFDSDPSLPATPSVTAPQPAAASVGSKKSMLLGLAAIVVIIGGGALAVLQPWAADPGLSMEGASEAQAQIEEVTQADPGTPVQGEEGQATEITDDGVDPASAAVSVPVETSQSVGNGPGSAAERETRSASQTATPPASSSISVNSVTVTGVRSDMLPGQQVALDVVVRDGAGATISRGTIDNCASHGWARCGVQWSSDNESVARVGADGTLTALVAGATTVRASVGGVVGNASVVVGAAPVSSVEVSSGDVTLSMGQRQTLTAVVRSADGSVLDRPIDWSADPSGIVRVDPATGAIEAARPGDAVVTAQAGGQRASVRVTVEAPDAASAVAGLLAEYERAFESGNIQEVSRVVTGISSDMRDAVAQSFQFMSNIDAEFGASSLDDRGDVATLEVDAIYRFTSDGNRQEAGTRLVFELERISGVWRIAGLDSR